MRAALVRELGELPELTEVEEPADRPFVAVTAAALNPLDVAVAAGRFYGGSPPVPYVPGCEGVGRHSDTGERLYVVRGGLGVRRDGTLAERVALGDSDVIPSAEDLEDGVALACGIAGVAGWLPLSRRAPVRDGDRVLVLGATGTAGLVAVQAARLLGAERVVAAGRNPDRLVRAREAGADETVELESAELADAFRDACGGEGPTLIFDAVWNGPVAAAAEAAAPRARIVHVGQSAGPDATLRSNDVRGKQLDVLGYSNFAYPADELREGYLELLGHVAAGRIRVEVETVALDSLADAWRRQADGPGAKIVVRVE